MKDKHSDHTVKITSSDLGGEKECREGRFTSKQSRSLGTRLQERHYELHVPGSVDFRVYANYCCLSLQPRTRTGRINIKDRHRPLRYASDRAPYVNAQRRLRPSPTRL